LKRTRSTQKGRTITKKSNFLIGLILVMVVSTVIAVPGWAAEPVVGLVDVNKILNAHPGTQKILEVENRLQEEMQKRQAELNEKGKGKTREDVQE